MIVQYNKDEGLIFKVLAMQGIVNFLCRMGWKELACFGT